LHEAKGPGAMKNLFLAHAREPPGLKTRATAFA
jgi:hypothetical protein